MGAEGDGFISLWRLGSPFDVIGVFFFKFLQSFFAEETDAGEMFVKESRKRGLAGFFCGEDGENCGWRYGAAVGEIIDEGRSNDEDVVRVHGTDLDDGRFLTYDAANFQNGIVHSVHSHS